MSYSDGHTTEGDSWQAHMRRGAYADAWLVSDTSLKARAGVPCWHLPRHLQYVWDGTPLNGRRVLVRCYHGLGDTIQFIRYLPMLKAIALEVIVWAQPTLLPLLSTVSGIDRLLPLHDASPDVEYDIDVEIMELPHIFRSTPQTLPNRVPYLHVPTEPRSFDERRLVGLVWTAGEWDARRSVPFADLSPLADVPGVDWHVLQDRAVAHGWDGSIGHLAGAANILTLASRMRSLDLIITVDSMPAHLAGALGVPVWTLLHSEPDWRWCDQGDVSPWYPTMRLFRQSVPGDWNSVIGAVTAELVLKRSPILAFTEA